MFDNLKPSASGRRCCMFENMQRSLLERMDPSCLTAGRPSIPGGKEVLRA
jgi:hypothetical protein